MSGGKNFLGSRLKNEKPQEEFAKQGRPAMQGAGVRKLGNDTRDEQVPMPEDRRSWAV